MKISVKELKSRIRTAEKRASEPKYKSEEIIQNAAQRDKNMENSGLENERAE